MIIHAKVKYQKIKHFRSFYLVEMFFFLFTANVKTFPRHHQHPYQLLQDYKRPCAFSMAYLHALGGCWYNIKPSMNVLLRFFTGQDAVYLNHACLKSWQLTVYFSKNKI